MNGQNNADMTIIVVSCDQYADMWDNFFLCKEKFWPDCPYKTILANNTIPYQRPNVLTINCGKDAQWSDRTRTVLNAIKSKYVCFVLEDFYFSASINTEDFSNAIELMERNGLKYYKLMSFTNIKTNSYNDIPHLKQIPDNFPYGISLMAAIWDRNFFREIIGEGNYNPWKFEVDRLIEEKHKDGSEMVGVFDNRNLLNICHMVVQGKYLPTAITQMKRCGIEIDAKMRGIMSVWDFGVYRFKGLVSQWTNRHSGIQRIIHFVYRGSVSGKYLRQTPDR